MEFILCLLLMINAGRATGMNSSFQDELSYGSSMGESFIPRMSSCDSIVSENTDEPCGIQRQQGETRLPGPGSTSDMFESGDEDPRQNWDEQVRDFQER